MSRPRYDWWGYIRRILYRYPACQRPAENNAIAKTIEETRAAKPDAAERIELIRLMYWANTRYSLPGAALKIPGVSEATAKRWHREFIVDIARNLGLTRGGKK